jgi:hypothetical protein
MTLSALRKTLAAPDRIKEDPFSVVRQICQIRDDREGDDTTHELILRALEHRSCFGSATIVLDALVREAGLFPYLHPEKLGVADLLAFEAHRPPQLDRFVFHHPQAKVFYTLMSGKSVVLSAPTSFGKSLIIDAIVATRRFKSIVVVVPTLALIDETRRRLAQFRPDYTIVTQAFQKPGPRSIFVMTQERVLDSPELNEVDFFVIDEFYKLNPTSDDDERSALLNQVFYVLSKKCKHFYLLGPGIRGLSETFKQSLRFEFIHEPYHTVVSELHRVSAGRKPLETLKTLAASLSDPTLVFCSSPDRAKSVAEMLPKASPSAAICDAATWMGDHYHPEWHLVKALKQGIGIHHGRVPRSIAQFVVRAFNEEQIRFLVCTSTLIEGVNTKAKNIIVYDHKIAKKGIDLFTFNNIRGRSGRMFQHFVGHVYLFHEPPHEDLPLVDVPAFTQGATASDGLLIQLDRDDLTDEAEQRIEKYQDHADLPFSVIKENFGVVPHLQLALADELASDPISYAHKLSWRGVPTYDELLAVCELIWTFFEGGSLGNWSARTPAQLAMMLRQLAKKLSIAEQIEAQLPYANGDPDQAVRVVLDFQRMWATLHFPKLLRAIGRIQNAVFSKRSLPTGDYDQYASLVEHLFLNPIVLALEEYGIPLPLARKLEPHIGDERDFDTALARIRNLDVGTLPLSSFEKSLIEDARSSM